MNENLSRTVARLKEIRESAGLSQKDFALMFDINPTTYNRYESGDIKNITQKAIGRICRKYGLNPAWLLGYEGVEKYELQDKAFQNTKRLPVLGTIAAGIPILAQEDLIGYEFVPEDFGANFCLKVKGDSMIGARILDGDIVYIRQQSDIEDGEIAAVIIDNKEATLKRVYKLNGTVVLRAENPAYKDVIISKKDGKQVSIIGKAIFFKSEVR